MRNNGTIIDIKDLVESIVERNSRRYAFLELLEPAEVFTDDEESTEQEMRELFGKSDFGEDLLFEMCKAGSNKNLEIHCLFNETRRKVGEETVTAIKGEPADRLVFDKEGIWVAVITLKWRTLKVAIWKLK